MGRRASATWKGAGRATGNRTVLELLAGVGREVGRKEESMRRWVGLCVLAFVVALAVVVGQRMDAQALAVVVGVVAGVVAGLPTAMLVLLALSRRDRQRGAAPAQPPPATASPPVVVIQGGEPRSLPPAPLPAYPVQRERPFVVVGEEDDAWDTGGLH